MADMTPEELVDAIGKLSSEDLRDLVSAIEEEFSVSAGKTSTEPPYDYTLGFWRYESGYKVVLAGCGSDEVKVVKLLRQYFDITLKEAIDFARNPPQTIKEQCSNDEAYDLKREFESVGATIALEPDLIRVYDPWNIRPGYAYD